MNFESMGLAVTAPLFAGGGILVWTVLGMGIDSALVIPVYLGGMLLYYRIAA